MSTTVLYALLAGLIPSLIWLAFWMREDHLHPESKSVIILTFCGGMLAVSLAVYGEKWIASLFTDQNVRYTFLAVIEEAIKFITVLLLALMSTENDEPIDAMIYCITVALGFAALENALFILQPLFDGEITRSIITGNMRFVGATLVHTVSSASIGFALGWAFYRSWFAKITATIVGFCVAVAFHTAFNLSLLNAESNQILQIFGWVWLAVVILIILFEEVKAVKPRTS